MTSDKIQISKIQFEDRIFALSGVTLENGERKVYAGGMEGIYQIEPLITPIKALASGNIQEIVISKRDAVFFTKIGKEVYELQPPRPSGKEREEKCVAESRDATANYLVADGDKVFFADEHHIFQVGKKDPLFQIERKTLFQAGGGYLHGLAVKGDEIYYSRSAACDLFKVGQGSVLHLTCGRGQITPAKLTFGKDGALYYILFQDAPHGGLYRYNGEDEPVQIVEAENILHDFILGAEREIYYTDGPKLKKYENGKAEEIWKAPETIYSIALGKGSNLYCCSGLKTVTLLKL